MPLDSKTRYNVWQLLPLTLVLVGILNAKYCLDASVIALTSALDLGSFSNVLTKAIMRS